MAKSWNIMFRWMLALGMGIVAVNIKSPLLVRIRNWDIIIIIFISLIFIFTTFKSFPKLKTSRLRLLERIIFLAVIIGIIFLSLGKEASHYYKKYRVLNASSNHLRYLGSHFIVGYRNYKEIKRLVSMGAIAGVYITRHNVREKTVEQVQKEIRQLQEIQKSLGLPPLFIAADQEGGIVSRLSPPLSSLPPISKLLDKSVPGELDKEIIQYASIHAEELSNLGVNMNLGPVVDLKMEQNSGFMDFHTLIHKRAISGDKSIVANVALLYSKTLEQYGVIPTLKHFPGLGRVRRDTHYSTGKLDLDLWHLEENDWIPFQRVVQQTGACIMMGHVIVKQADPHHPVSFSETVVQGIIRQKWKYEGILITDDLNMKPAYASRQGIGGAAVKALNAGVDLLLISYDGTQYYEAMYAVIKARNQNMLNLEIIEESNRRLQRVRVRLKGAFQKSRLAPTALPGNAFCRAPPGYPQGLIL